MAIVCTDRIGWHMDRSSGSSGSILYKLFVVLQNEDRIPVSRKYRVNVEKAGWI